MTPAFLNRFKIIYLEDQLLDINLKEFLEYKINELGNKKKETLLPSKSRKRLNQRYIKTEKIDNKKEENDKLISDLFNKIKEDNKNILNSISFLSFFIESVYIFKSELKNKNIENKVVIDYIFQLINPEQKNIIINPLASPSAGAPALKYGDVNIVTPSPGEVKGLMLKIF